MGVRRGERKCERRGEFCGAVLSSTPIPAAEEEPWWEIGVGVRVRYPAGWLKEASFWYL